MLELVRRIQLGNDVIAFEEFRTLSQLGIAVDEDLSICSFVQSGIRSDVGRFVLSSRYDPDSILKIEAIGVAVIDRGAGMYVRRTTVRPVRDYRDVVV